MQTVKLTTNKDLTVNGADTLESAPYVGPRPFKEVENQLFFGRRRETEELISLITAHPVVLLYAPSGAGKTSLVNAGLIPKLKGITAEPESKDEFEDVEIFDVFKPMRVKGQIARDFKLGPDANVYMLNAMISAAEKDVDSKVVARMTFAEFLESKPKLINEYGEPVRRVVIFDQFEELFTAYPERWEDRKTFFEQVSDALIGNPKKKTKGDPLLRVVLSMREDYIAELDPYAALLPECLRTRFRLEQMKEKSALEAVEEPLKKKKIGFAPEVTRNIARNLLRVPNRNNGEGPKFGQYIEPVQLQIVCQSLWEGLRPGETLITQKHLETYGDLSQALSNFYEKGVVYVAGKTKEREAGIRTWFEHTLIVDGNRAPVTQGNESTGGMPNRVVELLEKKSLLKKEWRGGGTVWFELAHDSFIEPIRQSNEEWRARQGIESQTVQHLEAKALRWQQGHGELLEGEELLAAQRFVAGSINTSTQLEAFVKASNAKRRYKLYKRGFAALILIVIFMSGLAFSAVHQRRLANQAWLEADLARKDAVARAEEANKNYEKEQELKRNFQLKSAYADQQKEFAEREKGKAESALVAAQVARKKAETLQKRAERDALMLAEQKEKLLSYSAETRRSADNALESAKKANSRLLALTAASYLDKDPELSVLLVQKAADEFGPSQAGEGVLRAGLASLSNGSHVLRKHSRRVNFVELSPDGTRVVTASDDKTAQLWKWEETSVPIPLLGHRRVVVRASFSPDGKRVVTACLDGQARVFDGHTGELLRSLEGHSDAVTRAVWSPDGKYIATASEDKTVKIWDAQTGKEIQTLTGHSQAVHELAWSPDGFHIATEGFDATGRIWTLDSQKPVLKGEPLVLPGLRGSASAIAFSPNNKMLITETGPGQATVWSVANGEPICVLAGTQADSAKQDATATITSVDFSPDSTLTLVSDSNGIARVWAIEKESRIVSELRGHTRSIYVAEFSPHGNLIVTASADNTARVWDAETGQNLFVLNGHSGGVKSADFSPNNEDIIVTGSDDGTVRVWDTTCGQQLLPELRGQSAAVTSAAFGPGFDPAVNPTVVTTGYDGTLRVWDARTGGNRRPRDGYAHYARVSYTAVSRDGKYLVTTSVDKTAKVWNLGPLTVKSWLKGHKDRVIKAAFSPDSKFVVTASADGTSRVWETETGTEMATLEQLKNDEAIYSADYSPDGESIITTGSDKVVRFWDAHTFKFQRQLNTEHQEDVYGAWYNKTGDLIVTASKDGTARVWNAVTLSLVKELKGHTDEVNCAAFSPNGQFLVTASNDKTARVWDTKTWTTINVLRGQNGKVFTAAFSPDSKYIVTASDDTTAHIYGPEMFAMSINELQALIPQRILQRTLAPAEWEKYKYETLVEHK